MKTYQIIYNDLEDASTHATDIIATTAKRAEEKFHKKFFHVDADIIEVVEVDSGAKDEYTEDDLGPNWW